MSTNSGHRNRVFGLIAVLLGILIAVVIAEIALGVLKPKIDPAGRMDEGFILYDERLGWKLAPGWQGRHTHHDFEVSYSVNSLGFRGRDLDFARPGSLIFLGDSFTFGLGVNDDEVFTELLNDGSDLTFLNAGVPGYSNDQQFLLLDRLLEYRPAKLVWVVYLGNDLLDNGEPFPLQAAHGKPFLRMASDGGIVLENIPVPLRPKPPAFNSKSVRSEILQGHQPYRFWQEWIESFEIGRLVNQWVGINSEALKAHLQSSTEEKVDLFKGIVGQGRAKLEQAGVELQVVLLPGQGLTREGSIPGVYQSTLSSILKDKLSTVGIHVVDMADRLKTLDNPGNLFHPNEGHFNSEGHRWLAEEFSRIYSM